MTTTLQRRLPGVRFEVPAPALDEALPRMDIALFVGFAQSGPLNLPVAVASVAEFEAIFGGAVTLAPKSDGQPGHGALHGAMRGFFAQGGQRLWVLRVAGEQARTAQFGLQQMVLARRDGPGQAWRFGPAWIAARAPGSWADGLRVGCGVNTEALDVLPVPGAPFDGEHLQLDVLGAAALALRVGDVLRFAPGAGVTAQARVAALGAAGPGLRRRLHLAGAVGLRRLRADVPVLHVLARSEPRADGSGFAWRASPARLSKGFVPNSNGRLLIDSQFPADALPEPGQVLRLRFEGSARSAWLLVEQVDIRQARDRDNKVGIQLQGMAWRHLARLDAADINPWLAGSGGTPRPRRALWLQGTLAIMGEGPALSPAASPQTLAGLSLGSAGSGTDRLGAADEQSAGTSLFDLPDDTRYFTGRGQLSSAQRVVRAFELTPLQDPGAQTPAAPTGRLALASLPLQGQAMLLPLAEAAGYQRGLPPRGIDAPALQRDGLAQFSWRLFADELLADDHAGTLAEHAQALRLLRATQSNSAGMSFGGQPPALRGMHAVFGSPVAGFADEPTLLAVPDAVHPGWQRLPRNLPSWREGPPPPLPTLPTDRPAFADCELTPLAAPRFVRDAAPDASGRYTLRWTLPEPDARFQLQEADNTRLPDRPDGGDWRFDPTVTIYEGHEQRLDIAGRGIGAHAYRIRAFVGRRVSPWSHPVELRVGASGYVANDADDGSQLRALHRLMLRTAAARGDLLAVLALPQAWRWDAAREHADALRGLQPAEAAALIRPLGADESIALSYGALVHPWLWTRRVDELQSSPADGALCGQLAAAALDRGAWIAVANRPLRDVAALALDADRSTRQALLQAQLNPAQRAPAGFVFGTAETLSLDPDLRPVNVRRLLSLLRRAALQRGAAWVFEPHGAVLARTVERGFGALLDELFRRGALAGRSAEQAWRVEVGPALNTDARRDAGQFWCELKVAPSLPLSFLTVRLVRAGERLVAQEQR